MRFFNNKREPEGSDRFQWPGIFRAGIKGVLVGVVLAAIMSSFVVTNTERHVVEYDYHSPRGLTERRSIVVGGSPWWVMPLTCGAIAMMWRLFRTPQR